MTMQQKIDSARAGEEKGVIQLLAASANANFADKIAAALLRAGYRLDPGEFDPDRIDAVVVLWTGVALDKPDMIAVARAAWKAGKLAPVSIGRIEPPFAARDAAPMDLAGWRGDDDDPRWRFVLSDLESIKIRQRVAGPAVAPADLPAAPASDFAADAPAVSAGDLEAAAIPANEPLRVHHPARQLWRNHIRPGAAPFMAGMAVVSMAGLAAFFFGARNDQPAPVTPALQEIPRTALREGADIALPATEGSPAPREDGPGDSAQSPPEAAQDADTTLAFVRPVEGAAPEDIAAIEPELPADSAADQASEEAGMAPTALPEEFAAILAPSLKPDVLTGPDAGVPEPGGITPQTEDIFAADLNQQALSALSASLPADAPPTKYLGDYFSDCAQCPDMAALDGGAFVMGAAPDEVGREPSETPQRRVTIGYRFAIATRETTFDQWNACVIDGGCQSYAPSDAGWGRGDRPVINVSYEDAAAYARWLSAKTGKYYRLPSEAEWEFAARAGTATPFAFGVRLGASLANINGREPYGAASGTFRGRTVAVTGFQPNVYGLFDMHGNVWEWTSDCWVPSHNGGPATGAARIDGDCSRRVIKGGAWNSPAKDARSAHRDALSQMAQTNDVGFRVVRILD